MRLFEPCIQKLKYFVMLLLFVAVTGSPAVFATSRDRVWVETTLKFSNFGGTLQASERANLNSFGADLSKGCSLGSILIFPAKQVAPKKQRIITWTDGTITTYAPPIHFETSLIEVRLLEERAKYIAEHLVKVHGYERQFIHIDPINRFDRYGDTNEVKIEGTSFPECQEQFDRYGKSH